MKKGTTVCFSLEFVITTAKELGLKEGDNILTIIEEARRRGWSTCGYAIMDLLGTGFYLINGYTPFFEKKLISILKKNETIVIPSGPFRFADTVTKAGDRVYFQTDTHKKQKTEEKGVYEYNQRFLFCIPKGSTEQNTKEGSE